MKNFRVFKNENDLETIIAVGGIMSDIHIIDANTGALISYFSHRENNGQASVVEPIQNASGALTGYATSNHFGVEVTGAANGVKTGQTSWALKGHLHIMDANHNLIKRTTFHNMPGGLYQFKNSPIPHDHSVRTECWGLSKSYNAQGDHNGFVVACGQGTEPDQC